MPPLNFTAVETERLRLVPLNSKYTEDVYREFTPAVARYMIPQPYQSKAEAEQFVSDCERAFDLGSDLELAILEIQGGEFLGCLGVLGLNLTVPQLGIWLKESAWGCGYGREALQVVLTWLTGQGRHAYALYPVDRENVSSRHMIEALGGVLDNVYSEQNSLGRIFEVCEYHLTLPSVG